MTGWLLDRRLLLELRKSRPDPRVKSWSDSQPRESFFLSAATIAAIRHYTERRCDAALQTEICIWLEQALRPWFAGRILPLTEDILLEWRWTLARRRRAGITLRQRDLFLVATARVHRLTICTRKHRAYSGAGARVFNPWTRMTPLP